MAVSSRQLLTNCRRVTVLRSCRSLHALLDDNHPMYPDDSVLSLDFVVEGRQRFSRRLRDFICLRTIVVSSGLSSCIRRSIWCASRFTLRAISMFISMSMFIFREHFYSWYRSTDTSP